MYDRKNTQLSETSKLIRKSSNKVLINGVIEQAIISLTVSSIILSSVPLSLLLIPSVAFKNWLQVKKSSHKAIGASLIASSFALTTLITFTPVINLAFYAAIIVTIGAGLLALGANSYVSKLERARSLERSRSIEKESFSTTLAETCGWSCKSYDVYKALQKPEESNAKPDIESKIFGPILSTGSLFLSALSYFKISKRINKPSNLESISESINSDEYYT